MEKVAAIYARVSSNQQKEQQTIQSQTAALVEYAKTHGYRIPSAWQFQDDGYSGATLVRPGLEAIRDLAATGQITAVLVYSPDRLSRKYAYQVVLAEEFARAGVELVFLQAPSGATAEDQLLLQFQGMIAEYERAHPPRQETSRLARMCQCPERGGVRLPLRQENRRECSLLSSRECRDRSRAHDV